MHTATFVTLRQTYHVVMAHMIIFFFTAFFLMNPEECDSDSDGFEVIEWPPYQ